MHEGHLLLGGEVGSSLGLGTSPLRSRQRGAQRERQCWWSTRAVLLALPSASAIIPQHRPVQLSASSPILQPKP